jgi:hypothetical protein
MKNSWEISYKKNLVTVCLLLVTLWPSRGWSQSVAEEGDLSDQISVNMLADDTNARLQVLEKTVNPDGDEEERWVNVCSFPCLRSLNSTMKYRVSGQDIVPSSPFFLNSSNANAAFRTGSRAKYSAGRTYAWSGGAAMGIGAFSLYLAPMMNLDISGKRTEAERAAGNTKAIVLAVGGGILFTAGLVGLIAGISMMGSNKTAIDPSRSGYAPSSSSAMPMIRIGNNPLWLSPQGVHFLPTFSEKTGSLSFRKQPGATPFEQRQPPLNGSFRNWCYMLERTSKVPFHPHTMNSSRNQCPPKFSRGNGSRKGRGRHLLA